jgi:cytochrome P450
MSDVVAVYPREVYAELVVARRFAGRPYLLVNDPDGVRQVLQVNADNYVRAEKQKRLLEPLLGPSLLTTDGAEWQRLRRIAAPAFRPAIIPGFVPHFVVAAEAMKQAWLRRPADEPVDIYQEMRRLTLSVIGQAMFGVDPGDSLGPVPRASALYGIGAGIVDVLVTLGLSERDGTRLARRWAAATTRPIGRAVELLGKRGGEAGRQPTLLALLDEAQQRETARPLSAAEARAHLVTLLMAGHATTGAALGWIWYLLWLHPEVREAVHAELASILDGRPPTGEDVARLVYLRRVVEESLRLYPSVPVIGREALGDDVVAGVAVPAGSRIAVSPWVLHRHHALWDEPDRFDPDRFTPERVAGRHRFLHIPFGAGPHVCIGAGFAMAEMLTVVAVLSQAFAPRLKPGHPVAVRAAGHLKPRHGLPMLLDRRGN